MYITSLFIIVIMILITLEEALYLKFLDSSFNLCWILHFVALVHIIVKPRIDHLNFNSQAVNNDEVNFMYIYTKISCDLIYEK